MTCSDCDRPARHNSTRCARCQGNYRMAKWRALGAGPKPESAASIEAAFARLAAEKARRRFNGCAARKIG